MATTFPSETWMEELKRELNEDEAYEEAASGWGLDFDGDFVFHIQPDEGLEEARFFYVGLEDGRCTGVREVEGVDEADAGFVYRGPYSKWKRAIRGEIGPIEGLMSGHFELDGDMQTLLQYSDAATRFVETSSRIDTDFV